MKRADYISWDDYFMGVAQLSSQRSKDPSTQVGCCIVNMENRIVGVGYNGFPIGCSDDIFPWTKDSDDSKYLYVVHAEMNAILNNINSLRGCRLYTTLFPCNECAKAIIQSGITKIIYLSDKYNTKNFTISAKKMFDATGVSYIKFNGSRDEITISLKENNG